MHSDHSVKTEVLAELAWDPMVKDDQIGVTVRDGLVTLVGHADSYWQKRAAETATARVKGVRAIVEEIEVRLPVHVQRSDDEIAAAAVNRLDWDGAVPTGAVKVQVEDGVITLKGMVDHQYQREAAVHAVQPLWGVRGVADQILIRDAQRKRADAQQISDDIRKALNRGWFAADTVHVETKDGTVTLSGHATTLRDRTLAVSTAWAAPGTVAVENHIRIG
ncbi:BON domain-containing protein (plasmid) [Rhodobacter capsulatus]|uniref:BON domain-containing protein n=1 Tax=Rhodobacter capsulatus TaxID=1061 RepID=UPI001143B5D9|nr:BON domain-containing protein [Rhodobacter capsulatus]TQD33303.1 BON domain-containing protein [Rhodobacter capsulatus]